MNRDHVLQQFRNASEPYDIIVVGGGATGLGTAVDAAARGHRTCLIEQADFAKGTSSRSTKLVHGGVRYLKQGNISLVLEALKERGLLYRNAPHLVHNMAFVIPNYKWWEGPFYGIGMKVYDRLAGKLGLSPSRQLSCEETLREIPTIETKGLVGAVIYHDGQFDDSRLAINLAQTAANLGAHTANYVRCDGLIKEGDFVAGVEATDLESGDTLTIRGRCVVNATGIFVDTLRTADMGSPSDTVAVSQGVHLVLPKEFLPGNAAIMIPKTADGRVLFAVPWHDCVIIGTTDTPVANKELEPRALEEERQFLLEHAGRYLSKKPKPSDVLSIFAGLRPLVKTGDSTDTATLSRDHTIMVGASGLVTVTGGKWTTYRRMAQDVIDHAEMVAGIEPKPCSTEHLQIHGWTHATASESTLAGYGSDAAAIQSLINDDATLGHPLHPDLSLRAAEVIWHARSEMARTVEDVLARRSRSLLLNARAASEAAPAVAKILAEELGRDENWQHLQIESFQQLARGYIFTDPASTAARHHD